MAWGAARKLRKVVDNLRRILAVEWVISARGVEMRAPLVPGVATNAAIVLLRSEVPGAGPDRYLSPELMAAEALLRDDALVAAVSSAGATLR
jgi:histidine ammonia-lyase